MKKIELTKGKIALVDDEDFEYLNQYSWHAVLKRNDKYAARARIKINNKYKMFFMHRIILEISSNLTIDHINGNPLDNRKENLRIATNQENQRNREVPIHNKLKIKGVSLAGKYKRKFLALIKVNKVRINLGRYNVLGDADSAYRIAEKKYFGEFVRSSSK